MTKLAVRRQAKLSDGDYRVLSEDLAQFELEDIERGLDDLGERPRELGETAFPDWPALKEAVMKYARPRRAQEKKRREHAAWDAHVKRVLAERQAAEGIE
jgi:hypothetical protein